MAFHERASEFHERANVCERGVPRQRANVCGCVCVRRSEGECVCEKGVSRQRASEFHKRASECESGEEEVTRESGRRGGAGREREVLVVSVCGGGKRRSGGWKACVGGVKRTAYWGWSGVCRWWEEESVPMGAEQEGRGDPPEGQAFGRTGGQQAQRRKEGHGTLIH